MGPWVLSLTFLSLLHIVLMRGQCRDECHILASHRPLRIIICLDECEVCFGRREGLIPNKLLIPNIR